MNRLSSRVRSSKLMGIGLTTTMMLAVSCTGLVYASEAAPCDLGWFGSKCQYKCHCTNNACNSRGVCVNGSKCQRGWFGASCQYQDWAVKAHILTLPLQEKDLILDDDHTTCYDNLRVMILTWFINFPISWVRIQVYEADPEELRNLTVLLKPQKAVDTKFINNPYINCDRKRTSFINNRTVDVHCDVRESVQEILIYGDGIRTMCGFNVNGGRNVALKQAAWQSSTLMSENAVASRAVDGGWLGLFKDNSCTHTDLSDRTPVWGITFSLPVTISRFEFLNRNDCCQRRLMFFSFESLSAQNTTVHYFKEPTDYPQNSFTAISLEPTEPVTSIKVAAHNEWQGHVILTLCEVELYGDTACPHGMFGLECNDTCNCAIPGDECFVSTGACASGCAAGYHGDGCKEVCSPHFWGVDCLSRCNERCSESRCDSETGQCLGGCQVGYQGPNCTEVCDQGYYGINCSQVCSDRCVQDTCNHIDGSCVCEDGYYGTSCSDHCSSDCLAGTCDQATGLCQCGVGEEQIKTR